nr:hypothetical protein [Propioniferax innocua]
MARKTGGVADGFGDGTIRFAGPAPDTEEAVDHEITGLVKSFDIGHGSTGTQERREPGLVATAGEQVGTHAHVAASQEGPGPQGVSTVVAGTDQQMHRATGCRTQFTQHRRRQTCCSTTHEGAVVSRRDTATQTPRRRKTPANSPASFS